MFKQCKAVGADIFVLVIDQHFFKERVHWTAQLGQRQHRAAEIFTRDSLFGFLSCEVHSRMKRLFFIKLQQSRIDA